MVAPGTETVYQRGRDAAALAGDQGVGRKSVVGARVAEGMARRPKPQEKLARRCSVPPTRTPWNMVSASAVEPVVRATSIMSSASAASRSTSSPGWPAQYLRSWTKQAE